MAIKIDYVSDIACPWCAVGLGGLEQAIKKIGGEFEVDVHFQPFELNPNMVPEGEDTTEHLRNKYGSTPEQANAIRETIRSRGAELGFTFNLDKRSRIYNTFDAHRLLHWAHEEGGDHQLVTGIFLLAGTVLLVGYRYFIRTDIERARLVR